ncbi:S4 domain-containing protein YaaA [Ilyobacter polytropus]|uniref:S4 domain protein YaaA n=1 Tax=Ilyobacter polytropus (strain ATCC 51220 / DSM 2926 / LMG 16218 / CuHBu1) TaxID=572544 RepID=E3H633_ILYPC|nr:S4 domain-containing protein YaaA [Ilyobacter polytropus]ADO81792.1 S4 domain protein YaaA [Ilyobacter polytropus DSM 2926]
MKKVKITSEFIKLDQFLKWADVTSSGVEAKYMVQDGEVTVNGEPEERRGRKLYPGDTVEVMGKKFIVE